MIETSQKFIDDMRAPIRTVVAQVKIDYTDTELDQAATVAVSENNHTSYPEQITDGLTNALAPILSLDGTWSLGDGKILAPSPGEILTHQMGWWGSSVSDSEGVFSAPPILTVEFDKRPIRDLRLAGYYDEYPVDFTIELYTDSALIYTETVIGNTLVNWETDIEDVLDINRVVIAISKWSHAGRVAKITESITSVQETYGDEDIITINIIEERESLDTALPIGSIVSNETEIELNNITRKYDKGNTESPLKGLLKPNRRIVITMGTETEMVPMGTFWSTRWDVPDDTSVAKVVGRDRISAMEGNTFERLTPPTSDQSLGEFSEELFESMELDPKKYFVDPAFYDINVGKPVIERTEIKTILRWIAQVGIGQVFSDRYGVVRVESIINIINKAPNKQETLYIQPQFPSEIDNEQSYGILMEDYFTLKPIIHRSDMANVVEITKVDGTTYRKRHIGSIELYGEITYRINRNPLLEVPDTMENVATNILELFNEPMDSIEMAWRGNPALELGDAILISTYKRNPEQSREYYGISKQTFEYAGYLRSKLTGRKVR